jgi:hypothetical protein
MSNSKTAMCKNLHQLHHIKLCVSVAWFDAFNHGHAYFRPVLKRPVEEVDQVSPVGTIAAVSTIKITLFSGARVQCNTPFGTVKP